MTLRLFVSLAILATAACVHEIDVDGAIAADAADDDVEQAIAPGPFYGGDPESGGVYALDISFWEGTIAQQEMDCFWDSGVRHIIAGTQVEEITRQQLDLAVRRGMTVDAYVYLRWDESMTAQVNEAFAIADGFPIGRMWLDVEEAPGGLGAQELIARVQESVDACESASALVDCGIYTGPGFWRSAMNNTTAFADVPLWYAWYNNRRALSSWDDEAFGGWPAANVVAKQWAEEALCGVGPDKNTMVVVTEPSVVIDRSVPPNTPGPPPAPRDLEPKNGASTALDFVKLSCAPVPHATRYELALETQRANGTWAPYFTWSTPNAFRLVHPTFDDATARFRVRAKKDGAWGPWSEWSTFGYGRVLDDDDVPPPSSPPDEPPPSTPPPSTPPTTPGAPTNLTPDGATVTTSSVTLACDPLASATKYKFSIETIDASGVVRPYFTYERSAPSTTFWPQQGGVTYRFAVQALVNGAWSPPASASFMRP